MIGKRGKKLITSEGNLPDDREQIEKLEEIENQKSLKRLIEYLKLRKSEKRLSPIDLLLFNYTNDNLKKEINEKVSIESI